MKLKQKLFALAGVMGLGLAGSAAALPTITNLDGAFDPFGGFDWDPSGTVMTVGPVTHGSSVTSYFMGFAVGVSASGGGPFSTPNMKLGQTDPTGTYEYTSYVAITETVYCVPSSSPFFHLIPTGNACGQSAVFENPTGTWSIYYDTSPDANVVTGAGIADGVLLIQGNVTSGGGAFSLNTTGGGSGSFEYNGNVTYTNSSFISPSLLSSTAGALLSFGTSTTNWTQPASFSNGMSGGTVALPTGAIIFQADGRQGFTAASVPEPGAVALLGIAVAGLGIFGVRRKQLAA